MTHTRLETNEFTMLNYRCSVLYSAAAVRVNLKTKTMRPKGVGKKNVALCAFDGRSSVT